MIEAIVASALLVVVALGVLKGLDTAQHSSGREKARAVAAALTEQDQERLRAFRAVDLAEYDETRTITVNNAPYEIVSKGDWIKDSTGGTSSCNNTGAEADYMRITTTTTSGLINSPIPPITMSSLVAPPAGKFNVNQGTLGVQVNNRDGVGTEGIPVSIAGPASDTKDTNSAGCAIFPSIPIGSYTATVTKLGYVDHNGKSPGTVAGTVTSGKVSVSTIAFDAAASAAVTFDTEPRLGVPPKIAAMGTQLSASNAEVLAGSAFAGLRIFGAAGTRVAGLTATNLFPFTNGYGLFGGGCPQADPTKYIPSYYATFPSAFIQTNPGAASTPAVVRLPSINLRVTQGGLAPTAKYLTAKILVTSKSVDCTEEWRFTGAAAIDALGWMVSPALPFGEYEICASVQRSGGTQYRRVYTTSNVQNVHPRGVKPPGPVSPVLNVSNSSSGASVQCF